MDSVLTLPRRRHAGSAARSGNANRANRALAEPTQKRALTALPPLASSHVQAILVLHANRAAPDTKRRRRLPIQARHPASVEAEVHRTQAVPATLHRTRIPARTWFVTARRRTAATGISSGYSHRRAPATTASAATLKRDMRARMAAIVAHAFLQPTLHARLFLSPHARAAP